MKLLYTMILVFFYTLHSCCTPFAVTWTPPSGRLGDQLIAYTKAKWIAWQYGGELLLAPFKGAEQFVLHHKEKKLHKMCGLIMQKTLPYTMIRSLKIA